MPKHIFITGGVVSSLGKGIASASIGKLMEAKGLKVAMQKLDPYINIDPGTMSPYQHGEVYVTEDGAETDLDLGHYERFTNSPIGKVNNVTTGQVYYSVITKERRGDYLGGTVQVVPHITDEIKDRIRAVSRGKRYDIVISEIGGTVGDIESLPFLEAARQFRQEEGRENVLFIHLTLVPFIRAAGELKTKPTQHSVGTLREIGIQPDILLCRTEKRLSKDLRAKIALFCNLDPEAVIEARDVRTIYEVPLIFKDQGLDQVICRYLHMEYKAGSLNEWKRDVVNRALEPKHQVTIGVVGKYVELQDAYKSLYEALRHAGIANDSRIIIKRINSERLMKGNIDQYLGKVDGILVPGGFGNRGIEGKIRAIKYARENNIPFLGICLGMQCAVIEFARNVLDFKGAHSTEFNKKTAYPVISLLEEQESVSNMGGTMRLGAYLCEIKRNTLTHEAYGTDEVQERHRHRYEFNNKYREAFIKKGLKISGVYQNGKLVEIVELENHPWFIACQFHPEFKSKPDKPHPLFKNFVAKSLELKRSGPKNEAPKNNIVEKKAEDEQPNVFEASSIE